MAQANQSDFLGSGGSLVDPFAGLVSPPTADDFTAIQSAQERQRRDALSKAAGQTADRNAAYDQQRAADTLDDAHHSSADWWEQQFASGTQDPNDPHNQAMYQAAVKLRKLNRDSMNGAGYKAATFGILAAPAAITGGAAAFGGPGALGFGEGAGTLAAEAPTQVANEATGLATAGPGFSQDAANAFNAATLSNAAGPGAAASVPTLGAAGTAGTGGAVAGTAANAAASSGLSALSKGLIQGGVGAGLPLLVQALTGGRTKEEKQLIAKQEQIAADVQRRQGEMQDARMNTLAQQMIAFNPRNQMLAQMFGPDAAFTPQQMSGFVQGPPPPSLPPNPTADQKAAYDARMKQYQASEAARQQMIANGFQAPGPGPAPINMPAPQAARKY